MPRTMPVNVPGPTTVECGSLLEAAAPYVQRAAAAGARRLTKGQVTHASEDKASRAAIDHWRALGPPKAMPLAEHVLMPCCPSVIGETTWQRQIRQGRDVTATEQTFLFPSAAQAYPA